MVQDTVMAMSHHHGDSTLKMCNAIQLLSDWARAGVQSTARLLDPNNLIDFVSTCQEVQQFCPMAVRDLLSTYCQT